jgi:uncharacterized iron-regulated membrane protein
LFEVEGPVPAHAAVDAWIAGAHRAYGDVAGVDFVMGPGFGFGESDAANLSVQGHNGKTSTVTIDPNTGLALGRFRWEDTYAAAIAQFHAQLSSV